MLRVLITLDGSAADARLVDLAGTLLAGRDLEITLLHVVPMPPCDDQGHAGTVVLEGYLAAETCDAEVAPLVEQLRARLDDPHQEHGAAPRLVPRHLIHRGDLFDVIERCGIAQARQDSLALLATYAQRLRQRGIHAPLTRDSAIGDPAAIIWETARHLGVDLVIAGSRHTSHAWPVVEGLGLLAHAPCPVLVVPATDGAVPEAEPAAAWRNLIAHTSRAEARHMPERAPHGR